MRQQRSVLDSVTEEVAHLQGSLPASDRAKLTEYLSAIRDVEQRIQLAEAQSDQQLPLVDHPAGIPTDWEEHMQLMIDLQVLAYQCDLTRVITFMVGREHSGMTYPQIGVPDAHHPISHYAGELQKIEKVAKINAYHVKQFAYYLERLQATPDGDGTLLDHMTMMYGAGIADSNSHDPYDIPIVLAGGGAGLLKGGRHIRMQGRAAREPAPHAARSLRHRHGQVRRQQRAAWTRRYCRYDQAATHDIVAIAFSVSRRRSVPPAPMLRLIKAVRSKDAAAVRALIKQRVDVNAPQGDGATALHWAAHVDDLAIADLLIRAGARATVANENGFTPLHLACTNRNGAMVERLLSAGADANAASLNGETVLMTCARSGEPQGGEGAAREGRSRQREGEGARPDRADVGRRAAPSRRHRVADRSRRRDQRAGRARTRRPSSASRRSGSAAKS